MRYLATLFWLGLGLVSAPLLAADVPGSKDHPVLTRYPASEIRWYDVQAFEPYAIATGPVTGYRKIDRWTETQGRTTRIYYELQGTKTHTEVFANYEKALTEAGFDILTRGVFSKSSQANEVGSRKWLAIHYARNEVAPDGIRLLQGSSTSAGSAFLAARKERAAGTVYVALGMTQYSQDIVTTMIDVIEVDDVETDLVTVDAEAMGDEIDEYGRVTLDGLFFDHDKATLTAESQPALQEIAKFLEARPSMNFHVVGHTDATGTLSYNQTLSKRRAEAVVRELVSKHGIAGQRLEGHGVGPLVPVFSNASDGGRAKNRRVELVERLN
ncbi:MAG: OmpA family protein [Acidobacteriota bacterium]